MGKVLKSASLAPFDQSKVDARVYASRIKDTLPYGYEYRGSFACAIAHIHRYHMPELLVPIYTIRSA